MASFDFPASPNDNDTYSLNGVTYKYVAAKQRWEIVPTPHNFETTAQLDIRDTANRDRANHTGTQDVSTITGLNSVTTSVTAPSSPIAGDVWWDSETGDKYIYYVDADGGQWVQSSTSSNLLTADVGTAAYLDVEEVATSQQGVKADSALQPSDIGTTVAPLANPTFTGTALILPNNSRINGVEHFYQTTKPTTRGDSSALVAGDRWWKTDDGTEWFWNGTYWLSPLITSVLDNFAINQDFGENISAASYGNINMPPNDLLIKDVRFGLFSNGHLPNTTETNHLIIAIAPLTNTGNFGSTWATYNVWSGVGDIIGRTWAGYTNIGDYPITVSLGNQFFTGSRILSTFPTINSFRGLRFTASAVGTNPGGNLRINQAYITYHLVHE